MTAAIKVGPMRTPAGALKYVKANFRAPVEQMSAIWVDKDGYVIGTTELAKGHVFSVQAMVAAGRTAGAFGGFLVHNDPSNDVETDEGSDYRQLTQQVDDALSNANISFIDHLIVTPKQAISLRAVVNNEQDDSEDGDSLSELIRAMQQEAA